MGPGAVWGRCAVIGEVLDRRYRIDAELGRGGMGVVYRATHTLIGKQCAIKVLRPEHARDEEAGRRFLREAQLASAIEHPHVVALTDFGQLPDGRVYYVMELLSGRSLAREIDLRGPLAPGRALRITLQVARGLAAAHAHGIVHRDLKPDNIFLCRDEAGGDKIKLFDFGIARAAESRLTRPGAVLGTPEYMPPEQTLGQTVDARADLYALGVILFEMLCGRVPLEADDVAELFRKQMSAVPPRLVEVDPGLAPLGRTQALIDRLLAKRPAERPGSAREVQHALLDAIAAEAPEAPERTTRALGSGADAKAGEGTKLGAPAWQTPAGLATAPRKTPAWGPEPLADTAAPGELGAAGGAGASMAPTMAMLRPAAVADAPTAGARVTQPQSLVHTPVRAATAPNAAPRLAALPSPSGRSPAWRLALGSAAAATVITLGGFGILHLRRAEDRPVQVPADPVPADRVSADPTPARTVAPAVAGARAHEERSPTPAAAPEPAPAAAPEPVPDVDITPTEATEPVPDRASDPIPDPPRSKSTPRAKKTVPKRPGATEHEPVPSADPGSTQEDPSSGSATSTKPAPAPGGASAGTPTPKSGGKRSIDLKDPFGAN